MKPEHLDRVGRNTISLMLISSIVALVLAVVYQLSESRIAARQEADERSRLAEIFPASEHDNDLLATRLMLFDPDYSWQHPELLGLREDATAYLARSNDALSGIILPATARDGYNGDIRLLIGLRSNGEITGVRVLQHRETPGLGDKIDLRNADWVLDFNGRSLASSSAADWTVKKAGGDFDQFTGATITPRAVVHKVRDVLEFYRLNEDRFRSL